MIGIFDSGLGGLTVAKSIMEILPQYQLMYLGDTARLPYGNRSEKVIYEFTQQGVDFLFRNGCEMVIVACNTMSASALRRLQQEWLLKHYPKKRVLGVIRPLVESVVQARYKKVGVIGTRATVLSGAYVRELQHHDSSLEVIQNASPLLVPLIEEGVIKKQELKIIAKKYLRPLKDKKVDALILGCTHYSIIRPLLQHVMGKRCEVLDSGMVVAQSLKDYLKRHPEIESRLQKNKESLFYVTDITPNFQQMSNQWLEKKVRLQKTEL